MAPKKDRDELFRNLKDSEEKYRNLVENFPDTILVYGKDGKFIFINQSGLRLLGVETDKDVVGKRLLDFVHPTYRKALSNMILKAAKKKLNKYDAEVKMLDGRIRYLEVTSTSIRYQGEKARQAIVRDLSDDKFRSLAEESPNIIFINKGGRVVYVNTQGEKIMGYTRQEFYSSDFDFMGLISPDSREVVRKNFEMHSKGKEVPPYEYKLLKKDGEEIIAIHTTKLIDYEGEKAILGILTDITERKKAEEALKESEGKYRTLFSSMVEGFCVHKVIYNDAGKGVDYLIMEVNPAYERILGIKKDDAVGRKASELYGSGEPPFLDIYVKVADTGEPTSFQTYFPPMGKHFSIQVFSPGKGTFATVFEDITERKLSSESLKESQEFLKSIVDNSGEAIIITNMEGRITLWSRGAEEMYGYRMEEVLGKEIDFLYPDELKEDRRRWQKEVMEGTTVRDIRTRIYDSKGELLDINLTLSALIDEDGKRSGTIGVSKDISERIEAERKLQEKIAELERWQRLTVDREVRMVDLKKEIEELKKKTQ